MKQYVFLLVVMGMSMLHAQVERVYDDQGQLRAVIPLNNDGLWHGTGLVYHPTGAISEEIPYEKGELHGEAKGFYPDGSLRYTAYFVHDQKEGLYTEYFPSGQIKLIQAWEDSSKNGPVRAFSLEGKLRIFAWMQQDSLLFAQHFDESGRIASEKVGYIRYPIDTTQLPTPYLILEEGYTLKRSKRNAVYLTQHEVPQAFVKMTSPHGLVQYQDDPLYPVVLIPTSVQSHMDIYLLIQTTTRGGPTLLRKVTIPVE